MADKLEIMLELERRGALPPDKQELLNEARTRGLIGNSQKTDEVKDDTPAWARTSGKFGSAGPTMYGLYGAGRELLRNGIETVGTTAGQAGGALIPVPGASYAAGGAGYALSKRGAQALLGEDVDTSASSIARDVATGSLMAGAGKLISKIPGVNKVLSPEVANVGAPPKGTGMANKVAETIMEKTLKVPPSGKVGYQVVDREAGIKTALDEGISVTKGGLEKTKKLLENLGEQMDSAVASNPDAIIATDSVLGPVQELRDFASKTVNGDDLVKSIDRTIAKFKKQYGDELTVSQAQEIKQNTNAFLRKSYGQLQPVVVEAQKQIVRGLKDRIAQEIPEIAGVNAHYKDLKNLEIILDRAVNRTGNWDWFSLSAGMAGAIVGGATGKVSSAAEAVGLWRALKSPVVQSYLALTLKNAGVGKEANAMANLIADSIYNKMAPTEQTEEYK